MSSTGKFRMNEGDWVCPDSQCGNINFARRSTCNRCGKEKSCVPQRKKLGHEIGKAAAEKSRGLFSADDWQCGRCGNVNWARRQQCNMCNAPKFGEVEERTGLGGGYNERENVEYIEREESDGEYDDFGRKKKKFRGATTENSLDSTSHQPQEDEEEEEDDEDADLSKYDLSGWSDDEQKTDAAKNNKNQKNASSRSRSLSSSPSRASRRSSRSRSSSSKSSRSRSRSYSSSSKSKSRSHSGSPRRRRQKRSRSRSRSSSNDRRSRRHHRRSSSSSGSSSVSSSRHSSSRKRADRDRDRMSSRSLEKQRC